MAALKLYNFHSSSASFRVRIGLHLKGLEYEYIPIKLRWKEGEHKTAAYRELNPQANVPVLVDGTAVIVQSLAIFFYLEHKAPSPPLLPADPLDHARVLSLAQHVACEIQPLNNLRVERYLSGELHLEDPAMRAWRRHWITVGFDALERQLAGDARTGKFCHGDRPGVADCFLVPQIFNARRPTVGLDVAAWPTIARIFDACMREPAFEAAQPTRQPDYE